jgi:FUS-interacting serine-arginine-rich protein 1
MVFSEMVPWYSCRESRGFGFVQYMDPADAADAQYNMDRQVVGGREITVVFAEENRKKPSEMRIKERSSTPSHGGSRAGGGGRYSGPGGGGFRRHSPPRSPARRFRSRTRSRTPQPRHHSSRYTSSPSCDSSLGMVSVEYFLWSSIPVLLLLTLYFTVS